MQKYFPQYNKPINSFDFFTGLSSLFPTGRYRGFDKVSNTTLVVGSGMIGLTMTHLPSAAKIVLEDNTLNPNLVGMFVSPHGIPYTEEANIELVIPSVPIGQPAVIQTLVAEFIWSEIAQTNPPVANYFLLSNISSLPNPLTQTILGTILVNPGVIDYTGLVYTPAPTPALANQTLPEVYIQNGSSYDANTQTLTLPMGNIFRINYNTITNPIKNIIPHPLSKHLPYTITTDYPLQFLAGGNLNIQGDLILWGGDVTTLVWQGQISKFAVSNSIGISYLVDQSFKAIEQSQWYALVLDPTVTTNPTHPGLFAKWLPASNTIIFRGQVMSPSPTPGDVSDLGSLPATLKNLILAYQGGIWRSSCAYIIGGDTMLSNIAIDKLDKPGSFHLMSSGTTIVLGMSSNGGSQTSAMTVCVDGLALHL